MHTGFYWRVASDPKSIGSAPAVASANFILSFGFHCGHTFIFPGGTRQPVGIVSHLLSRRARRSYAEHLYIVAARSRDRLGGFGVHLPNRVAVAAASGAAVTGNE